MSPFVLIHSPLVGPLTWSWVAEELRRRGQRAIVPSAGPSAVAAGWRAWVDDVVADVEVDEGPVLVGHSGAGVLLPAMAGRIHPPPVALVFVDAGVPPVSGEAPLVPEELLERLRALAPDGVLPPWSEWFGPGAMNALIPDADRRAAIVAGLPELPLSYFEDRAPMPSGWDGTPAGYVLLSDSYQAEAAEARSRGWPVTELPGAHLDIVTKAADVADALVGLAQVLKGPGGTG